MPQLIEKAQPDPDPGSDEDFENCKGQCGYTIWCRACMEERNKLLREAEQKENSDAHEPYT
jgi:hypothetical protein